MRSCELSAKELRARQKEFRCRKKVRVDMQREPVVFLPGMMCDMRHFGFQMMDIANDRSVMAGNVAKVNTISEIAKSVLDEAPGRFALIGLAMKGWLRWKLSGLHLNGSSDWRF